MLSPAFTLYGEAIMFRLLRALSLAFCAFVAFPVFAQQYRAGKLTFKNPGPYSQVALEAATGLHVGSDFDTAGLQKADQALMDTGLFDDAQAELDGNIKSVNVIFTLKPTPDAQLLPTQFENFVWWTPEELRNALQKTAPLFNDRVPEAGSMPDAVATALQAILAQKNIQAQVAHVVVVPTTGTPIRRMVFSISNMDIRTKTIAVAGAGKPELAADAAKAAAQLTSRPYSETILTDVLLNPYRNAGYLATQLTNAKRTPSGTTGQIDVDFTAAVELGDLYHVTALSFDGDPLLSAPDFNKTAKLHPGDVASRFNLLETLRPLDAAYKQQGYLDAAVLALPTMDTTAHTVVYNVSVIPGQQYRVRSVTPRNLTPKQMEYFQANWKLPAGELYSAKYVTDFLVLATGPDAPMKGMTASFKATADPESHTVDLAINFVGAGAASQR